jgi:hypothetical protein
VQPQAGIMLSKLTTRARILLLEELAVLLRAADLHTAADRAEEIRCALEQRQLVPAGVDRALDCAYAL